MLSFECDYNIGAHPRILERLVETNFEKLPGYREDHYCKEAAAKIAKVCNCPEADVHFLVGGNEHLRQQRLQRFVIVLKQMFIS